MASSISYYAKNLFKSSYGKDRPDFFIWYPKGTSASEKKLLHKLDFFSKSRVLLDHSAPQLTIVLIQSSRTDVWPSLQSGLTNPTSTMHTSLA